VSIHHSQTLRKVVQSALFRALLFLAALVYTLSYETPHYCSKTVSRVHTKEIRRPRNKDTCVTGVSNTKFQGSGAINDKPRSKPSSKVLKFWSAFYFQKFLTSTLINVRNCSQNVNKTRQCKLKSTAMSSCLHCFGSALRWTKGFTFPMGLTFFSSGSKSFLNFRLSSTRLLINRFLAKKCVKESTLYTLYVPRCPQVGYRITLIWEMCWWILRSVQGGIFSYPHFWHHFMRDTQPTSSTNLESVSCSLCRLIKGGGVPKQGVSECKQITNCGGLVLNDGGGLDSMPSWAKQ